MKEISAREARAQLSDVLDDVQWRGQHIRIIRRGARAAVCVPDGWYARAVAALDALEEKEGEQQQP